MAISLGPGSWQIAQTESQKILNIVDEPHAPKIRFPLVLTPSEPSNTLSDAIGRAKILSPKVSEKAESSNIRKLLDANGGAIHLKSLPLRSAEDFSQFLDALAGQGEEKWVPHEPVGMHVLRKPQAKNVLTVNEGPPSQVIMWHNEFGFSPSHPSYVAFFCLQPPETGGQTGVSSSLAAYNRLKRACPPFLKGCIENGISYPAPHPISEKGGQLFGNGLYKKSAFGPADGSDLSILPEEERRRVVDQNIRALAELGGWSESAADDRSLPAWKRRGFDWTWREDGSGVDITQRVPGVRIHPTHKTETLFTSVGSRYLISKSRGTFEPPHTFVNNKGQEEISLPPMYAGPEEDGPIPEADLKIQYDVQQDVGSNIQWEIGDVLIIDNFAVQHSRLPWTGDRRILASFWDQPGLTAQPVTVYAGA